jgi:hypothetical protein
MRGATSNLQRNGLLGSGSALMTLQLSRFVKETTTDDRRRVFTHMQPLLSFLDEVLNRAERLRVRQFLAELDPQTYEPVQPSAVAAIPVSQVPPANPKLPRPR